MEDWISRIPPVSRTYVAGVALITLGCQLDIVNKYQLFFSWKLIVEGQYWRLLTTFLYFGKLSIDTLFHLYFLLQYCQTLEENSFRGRMADFLYFLIFSIVSLIGLTSVLSLSSQIPFLSSSLTFTLTYLFARRNPDLRMGFLGLITFNAPYLPWALIGFSLILHSTIPYSDILGFVVGHSYYFLEDVYPTLPSSGNRRPLKTPIWFVRLVQGDMVDPRLDVEPIGDDLINQ